MIKEHEDTYVYRAFVNLRNEAKLMVSLAEWGAFPDDSQPQADTRERAYNLNSALDHAHHLVDQMHELIRAVHDEKK